MPKIELSKKMILPLAGLGLAAVGLILVIVYLLGSSGAAEEVSPDLVLTQAMETALARMTETPAGTPTVTNTFVFTITPLTSPTITSTSSPVATLTRPPVSGPTTSTCDNAEFIADITIPDGTQLAPGTAFRKVWELRNVGTCTWNSSYQVFFYSGNQMSAPNQQVLTTGTVAPGQTVQIAIDMIAPTQAGRYVGYWLLRNAEGVNFGIGSSTGTFYVDISVLVGGGTVFPTATSTGGAVVNTATFTPTATQGQAATSTPTNTQPPRPTNTPTPTQTTAPYPNPQR
jgi:hypothetical protein